MVQGFTRFREIQIGKQSVIGTAVATTRTLPYRGLITLNTNRTDPDVDVGSLDPVLPPYQMQQDVEMGGATGPLDFDNLAVRLSAAIKGGVSPTGPVDSAFTWTFQAASLTADSFDYYTVQTGDDTADSAGAGLVGKGGVINQFSQTLEEGLGPWTVNDDWLFAGASYGNKTGSVTIPSTGLAWAFGADTTVYLNSTAASIGATPITDAVRGAVLTVNNNLDKKRFANGSNTRFDLGGFGRGQREITLELTLEKTTQVIAEMVTYDDVPVPNRYIKISTNSTELVTSSVATKYRVDYFLPMRLFEVSEGEIDNNSNVTLTYKGFYDTVLTYAFKAVVVNGLSALP